MSDLPPSSPKTRQELEASSASSINDEAAIEKGLADIEAPDVDIVAPPAPEKEQQEETPAPPPSVPDAVPEAEIVPEPKPKTEETEEEFQARMAQFQAKSSAHPNTKVAIKALKQEIKEQRNSAKEALAKAKEFESKMGALETEYKGKVLTPEIESELKELRDQRREFHIENDPEFQAKYQAKLQEIDTRALTILRGTELPPNDRLSSDIEKFIVDNGGVLAMYGSSKQMPSPHQGQTYQQFIEDTLMSQLSGIRKTRIEQALAAGMDLRDEMSREIEHARTHGSELQQQRQTKLQKEFEESALATRKSLGKMAEKWDYLPNASKEEKAKIDKHNVSVEKAERAYQEYINNGKNPAKVAEAIVKATQSEYLMELMTEKDAEIAEAREKLKKAEEKLEKIKGSGSTGKETSAPSPTEAKIPVEKMSDDQAFDAMFPRNATR